MKNTLLLGSLLSLFLFSCSVDQQISLNTDGSGRVESTVFMEDFFLTTLKDLTDLTRSGANGTNRLKAESIASELRQNPFFTDVHVESDREGEYTGSLGFNHIEELFTSAGSDEDNNILQYSEGEQGYHELKILINNQNFHQLFQLFPVLQDPGFQYFLPEPSISEEEYTEMLLFIFEDTEGITERALRSVIRTASLNLMIRVDGTVIDQQGGQMLNNSTMKITLPLVKLLLHKEELNYSLRYKSR